MELVQFRAHNGLFLIQLIGSLEFNTSAALETLLDWMKQDQSITRLVIDLSNARVIDSTNLGIIAQMGLFASQNHPQKPILAPGSSANVKETLSRFELNQLYRWKKPEENFNYLQGKMIRFLGPVEESENRICERAIEAHQVLMSLSETNKIEFKSVVAGLKIEKALLNAEKMPFEVVDIKIPEAAKLQELEVNRPCNETSSSGSSRQLH